jgi:hypothetical protein
VTSTLFAFWAFEKRDHSFHQKQLLLLLLLLLLPVVDALNVLYHETE